MSHSRLMDWKAKVSLVGSALFCGCVVVFVWISLLLDVFVATSRINWPFTVVAVAIVSGPALVLAAAFRHPWMLASYALAILVVLGFVATSWHPRKAFVRDLYSITPGMMIDEVEQVMGRYLKGMGAKFMESAPPSYPSGDARFRATGTMTYRWNDSDSAFDADWGQVTFANGRVVEVEFLPD